MLIAGAYSQIAYGKLCARLFNYLIWWVRVMVEGWGFGCVDPNPKNSPISTVTLIVALTPNYPGSNHLLTLPQPLHQL